MLTPAGQAAGEAAGQPGRQPGLTEAKWTLFGSIWGPRCEWCDGRDFFDHEEVVFERFASDWQQLLRTVVGQLMSEKDIDGSANGDNDDGVPHASPSTSNQESTAVDSLPPSHLATQMATPAPPEQTDASTASAPSDSGLRDAHALTPPQARDSRRAMILQWHSCAAYTAIRIFLHH